MQIHIHKDGKNYGPYPLEQARQYLKAGNFTGNDLACHDGTNWIKLSDVPGVRQSASPLAKPIENHLNAEVKAKMKRPWKLQLLVIGTFLLCILSLIGITFYFLSGGGDDEGEPAAASNESSF